MNYLRYIISSLLLVCFLVSNAQNEQYTFSRIDIANGLSHNQVNSILKDRNGFLWFGTMSGLDRYDGYSIKAFKNSADTNSIVDNFVTNVWECPGNKLWVASKGGISIFDLATEKFSRRNQNYLKSQSLPDGSITNIKKDKKGNYWFVYDTKGLFVVSVDGKVAHIYHKNNDSTSIADDDVTSLVEDGHGRMRLVHRNGLLEIVDPVSKKVISRSGKLQEANKGNFFYSLFVDSDNDTWIWTPDNRGVFYLDNKESISAFNENSGRHKLNNNLVNGIAQDRNGIIWIATDHGGINLIDKSRNFFIQYLTNDPENNKSVGQNSINTIYRDNGGIIWLGTYKQGVSYINENVVKFAHYRHRTADQNSLQYDDVNRFVEDAKGNIWIGTNGGGLIYFDRTANKFTQYLHNPNNSNSLTNNVIVTLLIDHEQKLWIGTYLGGLDCYDGKKFTHYRHNDSIPGSIAENRVWELFEDRENNFWIGTLGKGVDRFDRLSAQFIHYQNKSVNGIDPQNNYVTDIMEDRHGKLWIGTAGGIDVLDKETNLFTHYAHSGVPGSLSNDNVLDILQDAEGKIWVGTREGLNLFDEASKSFKKYTTDDGLADNTILTLLEDNEHSLWMTTPNGLCNLIFRKVGAGMKTSFEVKNYDEVSNLQGREFNENAAFKTREGDLLVGGPYGFNIIHPSQIHSTLSKQEIAFTSYQVFNKNIEANDLLDNRVILPVSVNQAKEIKLKFNQNVFSIEFAALDFSHSNGDKYAYMLAGFNKEWVYTDGRQRKATYTNLDAGTYYFKVKALDDNGNWSDERALKITVLPPFWKTPLAFFLYFIAAAGILFLARKITVDRARMRFEVEQQRREADRMHAIDAMKTKFFTNVSHEFRTPLSLILSPLDKILRNTNDSGQKNQLQLVQRNAKRLLQLINQLLDFRKMEVQEFVLHPSYNDIINFTKDISYSFLDIAEQKNIGFSVESDIEALETYFDKDKLEKILFNLLSNAFKYTPTDGRITVFLGTADPSSFQITVKDNGIGIPQDKHVRIFERFFQHDVPESMLNQGTGIGLAITKEFVRLHGGTVQVESTPGSGTSFIVKIPVKKAEGDMIKPPGRMSEIVDKPIGLKVENSKEKPAKATILIVEDNEDFSFYLKDNLKPKYNVIEAADGKSAWQKTKEFLPDLIVSDIMMPYLTGIELAKRIKNDPRTAQIPIILLTAMDNEEVQIEGYSIGINDYIAKPFTFEILEMRIKNILNQQKHLKQNIERQIEINPKKIAITPVDEQFMTQANEAVERNISDPEYSVEDLSRDLFMSRVAVYKKILALTHRTPVEFIRIMRIKRGAQLLEKSQMTIAQVAYEVGFNNPKIFSRYFREEFNMLPSQYQAEKKRVASDEEE